MAVRVRTGQQILDGVAERADVLIADESRHTEEKVFARVNRSLAKWVLMQAEAGDDSRMQIQEFTTSASDAIDGSWQLRQFLELADVLIIRSVEIDVGDTTLPMLKVDDLERNDAAVLGSWWSTGRVGRPTFYRLGGTDGDGDPILQLYPWADAAYTGRIRYIPPHDDELFQDVDDEFDFDALGEEYVLNDAAMQTLANDGLVGTPEYAALRADNVRIEHDLQFQCACRNPPRKTDTRAMRLSLRELSSSWRSA